MNFKEIYNLAVPESKRKEEKMNIWAALVGRPLSVLCTAIFTKTKIKPVSITAISIICSLIGAIFLSTSNSLLMSIMGWFGFFLWALFDGIDGNLARCTGQCSQIGDLWDTTSGYAAMVLIYFSAGIAAYFDHNSFDFCQPYLLIILGGATAIFSIFPRLVMQKKKTYGENINAVKVLSEKKSFGIKQIVAMNLVSPSGFMQVIFLICIIFHLLNFFIVFYAIVNFGVMLISLYELLKTE